MKKIYLAIFVVTVYFTLVQGCVNPYEGKELRAAGDWSLPPLWNALEPNGLFKFDPVACLYTLSIGGLKPSTQIAWKLVINGDWKQNFGCSGSNGVTNGPDCLVKTSPNGEIRFVVKPSPIQLSADFLITELDFKLPCVNKFNTKDVRASGSWSVPDFNAADPLGLMTFNEEECFHSVIFSNLTPNTQYKWKVTIGNSWKENYGCNGFDGPNCLSVSNAAGQIRFIFKGDYNPPQLSTDFNFEPIVITTTTTTPAPIITDENGQTVPPPTTTTTTRAPTTTGPNTNPVKPCTSNCPPCTNLQAGKVVRASGDWSIDAGSLALWDGAEPLGLMTFDEKLCSYTLVLKGLKKNYEYKWKITMNNKWGENYGCTGLAAADCTAKTNSAGAIRLLVKASTNPPQLTTDYEVAPCGNGICEEGQTCRGCPDDCGECPPPICGDGVCDEGQSFIDCPQDCKNELPGCDRFNDESCKGGQQFHANEGLNKRRWQTPKPGTKGYQPSYQDNYALVGYADIRYTSPARTEADVCIIAIHKNQGQVTLTYFFEGQPQATECKRFTSAHKSTVSLKVTASDNTKLEIAAITLIWNVQKLADRPGDFRNGQKGAVAELFGWPHKDVEKECELIAKAGYLGAKLFPIHEQLMSHQPFNDVINPWYFMYQPVSYKLDGRAGTREELTNLITTCRKFGARVYADVIFNHFTGAGNDMLNHRNPSAGCAKWGNKTTSAPLDRQSPFYSHAYTYEYNSNTGEPPSNEFPGAGLGPEDFHCERSLGSWSDLFILNNGWLVGLIDIDTSKDNVRERQAAYLVEMLSLGISGIRVDAAKHISPEDLSAIFKKTQQKMGGQLPDDFFAWLEILTGGEAGVLWFGSSWYGTMFENMLKKDLGSQSEVDKIKMWDGLYPKEPQNNPISRTRVVIQNDDHDQQYPGSSSRDMGPFGCVLVKDCGENAHRDFEVRLFNNPNGVSNNDNDWPIRFILSSYYHTYGPNGIPDGLSDCSLCEVTCASCKESVPYMPAYVPNECAYKGKGYTRVHRDIKIINAMRSWMKLGPISGGDIGLPGC